jgi:hypothetical protein
MENGNHPRRTGSNRQKVEKLRLFRKIRRQRNVIFGIELGASALILADSLISSTNGFLTSITISDLFETELILFQVTPKLPDRKKSR